MVNKIIRNVVKIPSLIKGVDKKDLIVGFNTLFRHYTKVNRNMWNPQSLSIEVTYWCNRRCSGCYVPNDLKGEAPVISKKLLNSTVSQSMALKISFVGFAGGEPFSHFSRDIVYDVSRKNPSNLFFVYTNGDYIPQLKDEISCCHNLVYMVSLDGLQKTHDNIRGSKSFNNVQNAFSVLKEKGKVYGASVTVRKESLDEIRSKEFLEFLLDSNVKLARIRTLQQSEGDEITLEEKKELVKSVNLNASKYNLILNWGDLGSDIKKSSRDLVLGINGEVRYKRGELVNSFGNLSEMSLEDVVKNIRISLN